MAMTSETRPASSSAATRGSRSLPVDVEVAATTVAPLSLADLGHDRRVGLGQVVLEARVIGDEHLGRAVLGRLGGGAADAGADHQQRQLAARLLGHLLAERDRRQRRRAQLPVLRLDDDEDVAHQITFASLWSFCTSSSTDCHLDAGLARRRRLERRSP